MMRLQIFMGNSTIIRKNNMAIPLNPPLTINRTIEISISESYCERLFDMI